MQTAKENDKVKVHYKGTLNDGTVFDSSEGKDPLEFTLGSGQVIPGFDKEIKGMQVEETKNIQVPASEAYGEKRDDLYQEIPKDKLPDDIDYQVGLRLISKTPEGQEIPITVNEVKDNSIVIDANHPLAGEDLNFEIKLVEIDENSSE